MKRKKSYMNTNNILSENWLKNLMQAFKSGKMRKNKQEIPKKIYDTLDDLNDNVSDLEAALSRIAGKKLNLQRFDVSDFTEDE